VGYTGAAFIITPSIGNYIETFSGKSLKSPSEDLILRDGVSSVARFNSPSGLVLGKDNIFYVADRYNNAIRMVNIYGEVITLAGSGVAGRIDATGIAATFNKPFGIALDNNGNVYVADTENHSIRKISPLGIVTTIAGSITGEFGTTNAKGGLARFNGPKGIVLDDLGNIYVADTGNNSIRK
jgi:uncharacterized protein YjiK